MTPDEIRPHVGKGKLLVTVEVGLHYIWSDGYVELGPDDDYDSACRMPVDPYQIHSIRAVGEVCEVKTVEQHQHYRCVEFGCGARAMCGDLDGAICTFCGKPIKEASDGEA